MYKDFKNQDTFSDRLIFFLLHFAFFLKVYKENNDKKILQEIYDFTFRQVELSIREIGYGDQSINKKMKDYLNLFYGMIDKIHSWDELDIESRNSILVNFLDNSSNILSVSPAKLLTILPILLMYIVSSNTDLLYTSE